MDILTDTLKQGIVPTIIITIYLIVIKILDNKKELSQVKLNTELINSINRLSSFIDMLTKDIIDKDQSKCKRAIEYSIESSANKLAKFVRTTVLNNHIDTNKDNIMDNIKNIVNTEFYNIYSSLSLYRINNKKVSDYLNKDWISSIEKDIIEIIFNQELTREDKISAFYNKIDLKFQSYIINITNHVFDKI